ncbi:hypothetical protein M3193_07655 [Sporosarcina luteola]|uniref:hypothetical protein n=1 Tax=Sporosarcina luteola TaxID=582850 RepID=UPI00203FDEED|nr:hypothetical protein [Sporosarcina luteola]MCM3744018.1 hypothetical protein [Sporosarcina luteola]
MGNLIVSTLNLSKNSFQFSKANCFLSTSTTSFSIKNEGNVYPSWSLDIEDGRLNPGMSTTATVTFRMKDSYLMDGEPLMIIKRGIFFPTIMQFELEKDY